MKSGHIAVVIIAVFSFADAGRVRTGKSIEWYDCSGKEDGDYPHPYECTMFISCVAQTIAYEMSCAPCDGFPARCPYGRDVFDDDVKRCLWADETTCSIRGSTTATPPSTKGSTPETTPAPITTPVPTRPTEISTPLTSTASPPPTTTPPPTSPKPGDPCDPDVCKMTGNCQSYLMCDKKTKRLVAIDCGEGLFWNPLNPDGSPQIHGGNCDMLENISPDLQNQYRADPECLACFWKALGDCEKEYLYQPPDQTTRNVLKLECSEGLIFSEEKLTCQRCNNVRRGDGSTCCLPAA